ncbi:glycosyl hydrolase 115 family protein [Plebeiibacterium marinum]|uniref:Glycosyl hydrolase 115 family protein n=1 Tax=Plebeiibacterium marinum TaxID=2992111 RepID=A0AAE3SM26_9BACT|nr:glycosyl hydrolase 115 family protein [Plebeiobacterium marinum]MCW3807115.1 glycosyl hydrolase 115 family protein [Plebeiobacterium marinum]
MKLLECIVPGLLLVFILVSCQQSTEKELHVVFSDTSGAMPLVNKEFVSSILVDKGDAEVVSIVANAVAGDINHITGKKPSVIHNENEAGATVIIAGTIGRSKYIDAFISEGKVDVSAVKNKWECFSISTVIKPFDGVDKALVIVGSDRRGAAYGLFELSRMSGVSPWVYWADVKPQKRDELYVTDGTFISNEPSVKYRGIFINDEDWGLNVWAGKNIDTDVKDIGPKTYALVYELLLRLRGNFIWPAMHDSTKAFFYYKDNPVVADKYAIVMGSTHCDQMLRSNTFEWQKNFVNEYAEEPKPYRYDINKKQVFRYWDDRVAETKDYESLYTIGMRGVRDGGIQGPKTEEDKIALLDTIIKDQRGIFKSHFGGEDQVAQLFCPYKEVLGLYDGGLQIPDDVTLVWTDDNYGYIRRLSNPDEQKRKGSSGIYYHLSYLGSPHDYLWLSTISPSLISYEMTKAYQFGADRLWVVNVGDIKPAELETEFFMDLAWEAEKWNPQNVSEYLTYWANKTFGTQLASDIAKIKKEYYKLAQTGKPEHLVTATYDKQTRTERLAASEKMLEMVNDIKPKIPEHLLSAFFQLVEYPVKGMALMNKKICYAAMSFEVLKSNPQKAKLFSKYSKDAFNEIHAMTDFYNHNIENGKWDGIITDSPRNLKVYGMPDVAVREVVEDQSLYKQEYDTRYIHRDAPFELNIAKSKISLLADQYVDKQDSEGNEIITVKGLGLDGHSISRYPFNTPSYSNENYKSAPSVTYSISAEKGNYDVSIKCLPSRSIHKGRKLLLALVINDSKPQFFDVNHDRKDGKWKKHVLQGFAEAKFHLNIQKEGNAEIKIYLLDTGLAISRIDIDKHNEKKE